MDLESEIEASVHMNAKVAVLTTAEAVNNAKLQYKGTEGGSKARQKSNSNCLLT